MNLRNGSGVIGPGGFASLLHPWLAVHTNVNIAGTVPSVWVGYMLPNPPCLRGKVITQEGRSKSDPGPAKRGL